jgi:hypothetical protein
MKACRRKGANMPLAGGNEEASSPQWYTRKPISLSIVRPRLKR